MVPLLRLVLSLMPHVSGIKIGVSRFVLGQVRKAQVILGSPKRWDWDWDGNEVCVKGFCVGEAHDGESGGREQREGGGECVERGARTEKRVPMGEGLWREVGGVRRGGVGDAAENGGSGGRSGRWGPLKRWEGDW